MDPDQKNTIVSCFNDYSGRNASLAFLRYLYTSARFTFANCSTECRTCNIPTPNTELDSKKILTPITLTFCRYSTDLAILQTEKKLHSCLFIVKLSTYYVVKSLVLSVIVKPVLNDPLNNRFLRPQKHFTRCETRER